MSPYPRLRKLGSNIQDMTLATAALDSVDEFSDRCLGAWRYGVDVSGLIANYPTITFPGTARLDRIFSRAEPMGLRLCLLVVGGPPDNSVWRTLAGHAGSALTQRDGSARPSDARFQRMEASLYSAWLDALETIFDYIAASYDPNLIDIQWWNEPYQDNYPSAEASSGEFHIMSNALVPTVKQLCTDRGFRLLGPSTAGMWPAGLAFDQQIANETTMFGPAGVFKNWPGEPTKLPTFYQHFDALCTHAPYVSGDLYETVSPHRYASEAARKLKAHIVNVTAALALLGIDVSSKPWIVTEFGIGQREWSTFGRKCDDYRKGEINIATFERCRPMVECMYDYKAINSTAAEDNTNGTQLHQGKLANNGQWTRATHPYCQSAGNPISKSAPPTGSWPSGYFADGTGHTTTPEGTPGQE